MEAMRALAVDRAGRGRSTTRPMSASPTGHREDAAGRLDRAALLDVAGLAEDDRADRVLVEVQREAERAALELEHLVDRGLGEAGDAGDAVAHLEHLADVGLRRAIGENVETCAGAPRRSRRR